MGFKSYDANARQISVSGAFDDWPGASAAEHLRALGFYLDGLDSHLPELLVRGPSDTAAYVSFDASKRLLQLSPDGAKQFESTVLPQLRYGVTGSKSG